MEKWQVWFMIGGGIYLLLIGILMFKSKEVSMRRGIGIYNMIIGGLSVIGGSFSIVSEKHGEIIFNVFISMIVLSLIIFNALKLFSKKG